ncbi:MAG: phosphate ABC transporter permease PstA [Caldilineaceae bacterium]|nr:phosphate ABC transporter permease PstA [Caldilineaceae bacterium]
MALNQQRAATQPDDRLMPSGPAHHDQVVARQRRGRAWAVIFQAAMLAGIIALCALLLNILNQSFGYVAIVNTIDPAELAVDGAPLDRLPKDKLVEILEANISSGLMRRYEHDKPFDERSRENVHKLILERVVEPQVQATWGLFDSLFARGNVFAEAEERYPGSDVYFRSWLTTSFISKSQSSEPLRAGVRTAILGSLWVVAITILFSFPIGVGAAIYLEEYAHKERVLNRLIQTNINNLAGVPSIIYGMLGLAIFVRILEVFTSGAFLGVGDQSTANGRTIISAGLTLGLLILPLIIINGQEAIRAVPGSLRQAGFGLGATHWQVIWHHVLPSAVPGILTGTILAVSRAIGETAPLVVVGASTFIALDPNGPFSKFTVLPIQIYQWTSRPQDEFRNLAAAAILVLLILLLSLNASAVLLRNRFDRGQASA